VAVPPPQAVAIKTIPPSKIKSGPRARDTVISAIERDAGLIGTGLRSWFVVSTGFARA